MHVCNFLLHIPTWMSDRQLKFHIFETGLLIQSLPPPSLCFYSIPCLTNGISFLPVSCSNQKNKNENKTNLESSLILVIFDICLSLMPHIQSNGNLGQLNLGSTFSFQTTPLHFHCYFPHMTAIHFLLNSLNCLQTDFSPSILTFFPSLLSTSSRGNLLSQVLTLLHSKSPQWFLSHSELKPKPLPSRRCCHLRLHPHWDVISCLSLPSSLGSSHCFISCLSNVPSTLTIIAPSPFLTLYPYPTLFILSDSLILPHILSIYLCADYLSLLKCWSKFHGGQDFHLCHIQLIPNA